MPLSLFLDSGAYSALTQGVEIDLDRYILFIKEYEDVIDVYSVLDDISDPEITLKNQLYMERAGLKPVPCYHFGEDIKYLKHYGEKYDYISLGGLVGGTSKQLQSWLDVCWQHLVDKKGMPICKVHAFGMTSVKLMNRYPWYSVDSTAWIITSRMGNVYVPRKVNGEWDYTVDAWKITFSNKSPTMKQDGKHFDSYPPIAKQEIIEYLDHRGYKYGMSDFKEEHPDYELADDERWYGKAVENVRTVEIILEEGVSNSYKKRDEMNILYFMDLEKAFPEWPYAWNGFKSIKKGLDIF